MARNIQRGRDHGIPTYNTMRRACKLARLTSLSAGARPREIPRTAWAGLASVYSRAEEVDLLTGGLAETPLAGAMVGPTLACILGKQFNALLFGDRFFFSHSGGEGHQGLAEPLKQEIRQRSLRDIICDNTNIASLQRSVLRKTSQTNPSLSCRSKNTIDFNIVKEHLAVSLTETEPDDEDTETEVETDEETKPQKPQTTPVPIQPKPTQPKPKPVSIKPKPTEAKPKPVETKPKPVETKPKPVETKPKPTEAKPKPIPAKPIPAKPKPATVVKPDPNPTKKCKKDKLSFCQWLIPKCSTSAKTRADCCKTCGGIRG